MAEPRTLARPYAEALFELAKFEQRLADCDQGLQTLAAIAAHPDVAGLIGNPQVGAEELASAMIGIAGDDLHQTDANMARLLADNRRLPLLPEIASQFAELRAKAESRIEVTVTTAAEIPEAQQQALVKALEKKLARTVGLATKTDADLIGGAIVRAGDLVIDGSVRAQLARLAQTIAH